MEVWNVSIVGVGTMGLSIAQFFAMKGHKTSLYNRTSDEVVDKVYNMLKESGKSSAILNKAVPGFIVNRLSVAIAREAIYMVEQGWTTPEDIDAAITSTFGPRYPFEGHFELFDHIGLYVGSTVINLMLPHLCNTTEPFKILDEKVKVGELGVKSGKGFKKYDDVDKVRRDRDKKIIKVLEFVKTLE